MAFIEKMAGQDYIQKTRAYLDYLEEHLENVKFAFTELSNACDGKMAWVGDDFSWHTLRQQVVEHDLSKFSKEEFVQYRASFFPISDDEKEKSDMSEAWENHKTKNHHHHESIENYLDLVHMVIDWTAMGYKFGDTAQAYYENNKDKMNLTQDHETFVCEMFDCINKHRVGVLLSTP